MGVAVAGWVVGAAVGAAVGAGGVQAATKTSSANRHRRLAVRMGLASYCGELGETDKRMGHKRCLTWHEMEKLIVDAGFRILERRGMITKVLPNSMLVHCSDEQLRGLFDLGLELPMDYAAAVFFLAEARPL